MNEQFLVLPKLIKEERVEKVANSIIKPDVSMLNEEQREIFNKITTIKLHTFSKSLLTGYSGTGKTFLVTKIIEEILYQNKAVRIAITAPTNKAVRVLKNLSSICETHSRVEFNTLHSLLGLKRFITSEGKEEYKAEFGGGDIGEFDIVLVDEVSMLDNELYEQLLDSAEYNNILLLFIGDRGQIPPVNGGESRLFTEELENSFNLTKIIRQAGGNPIIQIAQKIRTNEEITEETIVDDENNGVIFLKINTEMPLLEKYFKSENFNKNANFVKVLAWTNRAVDYYNDKIRAMIYGEKCGKLNIGEKMVCNKPITDSKKRILLNNNDEFEVLSYEIKTETTAFKFSYYAVRVLCNGKTQTIKLLAEKSETAYQKELKILKDKASKASPMLRRNAWVKYFNLLGKYADVKYNYALTVHKSQGSTFDNAIVINCDIKRVQDKKERNKLLYTAVTRAKNKLFVI
jgi:ATP-dependent exoDNAse (exonuclease V) alpha subunit